MVKDSQSQMIRQLENYELALSKKDILLKICLSSYKTDNLQTLIDEIVQIIMVPNISSSRCMVYSPWHFSKELGFSATSGTFADQYGYLDEQIWQQVRTKSPFIISDTTRIHTIKFHPEKPYPKAILAFALRTEESPFGMIWLGFEGGINFSRDDNVWYEEIIKIASSVLEKNMRLYETVMINQLLTQQAEQTGQPNMIFINDSLVYKNSAADQVLNQLIPLEKRGPSWLQEVYPFFKESLLGEKAEFKVGDFCFLVLTARNQMDNHNSITAVTLIDRSTEQKQSELTALIIEMISRGLNTSINHCLSNLKMLSLIGELNTNQNTYIDHTRLSLMEIARVADDLTAVDRFTGQNGIKIKKTSLEKVIKHVIGLCEQKIRQKRIELQQKMENIQREALLDETLFSHVIYAILNFTIDRSRFGGIITIEADYTEKELKIMITDASKGMAQAEIDQIYAIQEPSDNFSDFFLAKRITQFLGGKLTINNKLIYGCQFVISLPK